MPEQKLQLIEFFKGLSKMIIQLKNNGFSNKEIKKMLE